MSLMWVIGAAWLAGCAAGGRQAAAPRPRPDLRVTQHAGGTHRGALVSDGLWRQALGPTLLVLEPSDGSVIDRVEFGEAGDAALVADMLIHGESLFVVLRDQAVVRLEPADGAQPNVSQRWEADGLGVCPRRLSATGGEVYASGPGGVVRLSDAVRVYESDQDVGSVVISAFGLIVTVGRRVYRLDDERFVGSASELAPIAQGEGLPGAFAFIRHGAEATTVGLMTDDLREIDAQKATIRFAERVHRVRVFDGLLWVVCDSDIRGYEYSDGGLKLAALIEIAGGRDVAELDANHLAIAGAFGRALYRRSADDDGPGREIIMVDRALGELEHARFDGRHVQVSGPQGSWLYHVEDGQVERLDHARGIETSPSHQAATIWFEARIDEGGYAVSIETNQGGAAWSEPGGEKLHCVAAIDGRLWIGREGGITVLGGREPSPAAVVGELRLDGPVRFVFPLLSGGGAIFVTGSGGIGEARLDEPW